jgi:hypothetical protein
MKGEMRLWGSKQLCVSDKHYAGLLNPDTHDVADTGQIEADEQLAIRRSGLTMYVVLPYVRKTRK